MILGKFVGKENISILETTQIVLMVWSQQMDIVLIVYRVLKMWQQIGQKDVSNWQKL